MPLPQLLTGLSEIAHDYDALVCDVWGVLHNGSVAMPDACAALKRFRETQGRVVLLSNAPRPKRDVEAMFARLGVALDCYDEIVTSGIATRADLERRRPRRMLSGTRARPGHLRRPRHRAHRHRRCRDRAQQ